MQLFSADMLALMISLDRRLGLELVGGASADKVGTDGLVYQVVAATEESLEMIGIATFIFALSDYACRHCKRIGVIFGGSETRS